MDHWHSHHTLVNKPSQAACIYLTEPSLLLSFSLSFTTSFTLTQRWVDAICPSRLWVLLWGHTQFGSQIKQKWKCVPVGADKESEWVSEKEGDCWKMQPIFSHPASFISTLSALWPPAPFLIRFSWGQKILELNFFGPVLLQVSSGDGAVEGSWTHAHIHRLSTGLNNGLNPSVHKCRDLCTGRYFSIVWWLQILLCAVKLLSQEKGRPFCEENYILAEVSVAYKTRSVFVPHISVSICFSYKAILIILLCYIAIL